MPRVGVVGGGAVGLYLYGKLAQVFPDALLYVRRRSQREVLLKRGVQVSGRESLHRDRVLVKSAPHETLDWLFVCCKAYNLEGVLEKYLPALAPSGALFFLQNGWGFWERLRDRVVEKGGEPYALSVTFGVTRVSDHEVILAGRGGVHGGALSEKREWLENAFSALQKGGLSVVREKDIFSFLFQKACVNACINPVTTILEAENGVLLEESLSPLLDQCVAEFPRLSQGERKQLRQKVLEIARNTAQNKSSMLQDLWRGEPTEITFLNGQFSTPTHQFLTHLVEAKSLDPLSLHSSS